MLVAEKEPYTKSLNPRRLFENASLEMNNITSACLLGDPLTFLLPLRNRRLNGTAPSYRCMNKQILA